MNCWRSLLFVPADAPQRLAGAHSRGADAVILDLEDSVAPGAKPDARRAAPDHLQALAREGADVVVRINSGWRDAVADLEAIAHAPVAAIMAPKATAAWRIRALAEMLDEVFDRAPPLIALVESAAGVAAAQEIACIGSVAALAFGSEDLAADLGCPPSPVALDLPCRQLALAAAAGRVESYGLPDTVANFIDMEAFDAAAVRARGFGISGALCIHPRQVSVANRVFGSTAEERAKAQRVLEAWNERGAGQGVAVLDGRMIDAPVAAQAERLLARRHGDDPRADRP